jgi:hypothetical protein
MTPARPSSRAVLWPRGDVEADVPPPLVPVTVAETLVGAGGCSDHTHGHANTQR